MSDTTKRDPRRDACPDCGASIGTTVSGCKRCNRVSQRARSRVYRGLAELVEVDVLEALRIEALNVELGREVDGDLRREP